MSEEGTPKTPTPGPGAPSDMTGAGFEELQRNMDIAIDRSKVLAELEERRRDAVLQTVEAQKKRLAQEDLILRNMESALSQMLKSNEIRDEDIDKLDMAFKQMENINKGLADKLLLENGLTREMIAQGELTEEQQKKMKGLLGDMIKIGAATEDATRESAKMAKVGSKIAGTLGVSADLSSTMAGSMADMAASLLTGRSDEKMKAMGESIFQAVNPLNLMANLMDKFVKNILDLDKVGKAFQATTGFTKDFNSELMQVYGNNVRAGVSLQDSSAAMSALATEYSGFNPNAEEANAHMAENIALLGKMGVQAAQSAKMMEFFNKNLGKTSREAATMTRNLTMSGRAIGISANKMASDFNAVSSNLAAFGDNAVDVFKSVAAQAKDTGMEVNELISIAEGFDTFTGAAEKTAKLNAVLGTQLSSMQMVNMSHEDRIRFLRQELHQTVGNMESLDRYTQMFIAQQIAGGDVAKAQRLVNMSTSEYIGYEKDMKQRQMTQEQLAEAAEKLVPVMEQISLAFAELAANDAVVSTLEAFAWLVKLAADHLQLIIFASGAWAIRKQLMIRLTHVAANAKLKEASATNVNTAAWKKNEIAQARASKKALAMSVALGLLMAAFLQKGSPMLYMMPQALAYGIVILGRALDTIKGQAMLAAIVLAVLAASLGLIFYSLALLVDSMVSFLGLMIENMVLLPQLALNMYLIGGALMFLAYSGALAAVGLTMSVVALAAMFAMMKLTGVGLADLDLTAVGEAFINIGSGVEKYVAAIRQVASIATDLQGAVGDGMLAATIEGGRTSVVFSGNPGILTTMNSDKLTVDVNIPEITIPKPEISVYLNGDIIRGAVDEVIMEKIG